MNRALLFVDALARLAREARLVERERHRRGGGERAARRREHGRRCGSCDGGGRPASKRSPPRHKGTCSSIILNARARRGEVERRGEERGSAERVAAAVEQRSLQRPRQLRQAQRHCPLPNGQSSPLPRGRGRRAPRAGCAARGPRVQRRAPPPRRRESCARATSQPARPPPVLRGQVLQLSRRQPQSRARQPPAQPERAPPQRRPRSAQGQGRRRCRRSTMRGRLSPAGGARAAPLAPLHAHAALPQRAQRRRAAASCRAARRAERRRAPSAPRPPTYSRRARGALRAPPREARGSRLHGAAAARGALRARPSQRGRTVFAVVEKRTAAITRAFARGKTRARSWRCSVSTNSTLEMVEVVRYAGSKKYCGKNRPLVMEIRNSFAPRARRAQDFFFRIASSASSALPSTLTYLGIIASGV
jgi:hypothetical protein